MTGYREPWDMISVHCPHGDESFFVVDYLSGRLSDTEASAFEEHAFGCDRCFAELQRATELKAAAGDAVAATATLPRSPATPWPAFALAAAVLLGIGLWLSLSRSGLEGPEAEPVYRHGGAGGAEFVLSVGRSGEQITLDWESVAGADLYEVRVFDESGDPVFEQESPVTSLQVPVAEWQGSGKGSRFEVQVIALDELRQTVARSEFEPL